MPLICGGCFGEEQVIPVKEEQEDVTDLKVIPDVRQMKNKNRGEDSIMGKEMDEPAKVPTSIDTTPSSNVSSYSMEQEEDEIVDTNQKVQEDIATTTTLQEDRNEDHVIQ